MGIKWNGRRKGSKSWLVCPLMAFALAVGLIAAVPGMSGEAKAVNLEESCSLTVAPAGEGDPEFLADVETANVVIDIYKVAEAIPTNDGYDTYTYTFGGSYNELEGIYKSSNQRPDNDTWKAMAQAAANVALKDGSGIEPVKKGEAVDKKVEGLSTGLYLLIARGSDVKNYKTTVTTEEGEKYIATIANSKTNVYTFAPELISLPSKQAVDADGNVSNTTAGNGDWIYNMQATLKPSVAPRYGSLEIVKGLTTYNVDIPAVFVFQVEAELAGDNVYSNIVTLEFTDAGEKSALIDKIPVGAKVTVTEVYSGASYKVTSVAERNATIDATEVSTVRFTNDYETTTHSGGGVNNHFTYDTENGWQWENSAGKSQ